MGDTMTELQIIHTLINKKIAITEYNSIYPHSNPDSGYLESTTVLVVDIDTDRYTEYTLWKDIDEKGKTRKEWIEVKQGQKQKGYGKHYLQGTLVKFVKKYTEIEDMIYDSKYIKGLSISLIFKDKEEYTLKARYAWRDKK